MYECVMAENIHESLYDICESIYDNMCYCENNSNDDHLLLVEDLINFIVDKYSNGYSPKNAFTGNKTSSRKKTERRNKSLF